MGKIFMYIGVGMVAWFGLPYVVLIVNLFGKIQQAFQ